MRGRGVFRRCIVLPHKGFRYVWARSSGKAGRMVSRIGFWLSCACRIMDIHDEFSFKHDDVIETLSCRKFLGSNDIIPHYTACFTDTGSSSAGFALTIPITWKVLMDELHEEFDLAPHPTPP